MMLIGGGLAVVGGYLSKSGFSALVLHSTVGRCIIVYFLCHIRLKGRMSPVRVLIDA